MRTGCRRDRGRVATDGQGRVGPVIRIRLVSIMGGAGVKRGRKLSKAERKRQKELREAERLGELDA